MKVKLRGVFKLVDKYNRVHLAYLSVYHWGEVEHDHTKQFLERYDTKFKKRVHEMKQPENVDEVIVKCPIQSDQFILNLNKKVKFVNDKGELILYDELLTKDVLIDATITNYNFPDKTNKCKKIIGWKIKSGRIQESKFGKLMN